MNNNLSDKGSIWYKEPWACLVFFLPLSAVIAGITTLIIANINPDSFVVGDYYKKGKAINLTLDKIKQAQKLGINFQLTMKDHKLLIRPTGIEKNFSVLKVKFYHPTLANKDFSLSLTANGKGDFTHLFEQNNSPKGKWRITLSSFKNDWKITSVITLPQNDFTTIVPIIKEAQ